MIGLISMRSSVYIRPHAMRRLQERTNIRGSPEKIAGWIYRVLRNQLAVGMEANRRGAFELELRKGLVAVIVPGKAGGWVVLTFIPSTSPAKLKLPG